MNKRLVVLASLALMSLALTLVLPGVIQSRSSTEIAQVKTVPSSEWIGSRQEAFQPPSTAFGASTAGVIEIKDTSYPIPDEAYFVSPDGSDTNPGSQDFPWSTLRKAINSAPPNSTIVVREGTYREGDLKLNKKLTLQPYPHEKVWIKGSLNVRDWVREGKLWRKDNWNYQFAPITNPKYIDPAYPIAAYKDMVFVNGDSYKQVMSKAEVTPGKFYADYSNDKLYIANEPSDKTIEATAFGRGLLIQKDASGSVVRGIGFSHYAEQPISMTKKPSDVTLENNTFAWNAVMGVNVYEGADIVVRGNTFSYNGRLGLHGTKVDRILLENNTLVQNNVENFALNWDAAGAKFVRVNSLILRDNIVDNNNSTGLWVDVSSTNATIVRNIARNNQRDGIFFELSHKAIIASNLVVGNARRGINVIDSSSAKVYNNTVVNSPININVLETRRTNTNAREAAAGVTWETKDNVIKNNILLNPKGAVGEKGNSFLLSALNDTNTDNDQMVTELNSNAYYRTSSSVPRYVIRYRPRKRLAGMAGNFKTVSTFASSTGFEKNALAIDNVGTNPLFIDEAKGDYRLKSNSPISGRGEPLPADIANAIGVEAGAKVDLGALGPTSVEQTPLADIRGHWAQAFIQTLAARDIISGFPDGTFRPNVPVTRAEFAAIIAKAFTPTQQNNNTTIFQDVPQGFWGYSAIQTAARSGFLAGYPGGVFQPNQQIPRVQVLVSLTTGLKLGNANTSVLSFYQDTAQIPVYAVDKVAAATRRRLVVNYPAVKLLNPNREATRAEVAAFIYQALVNAKRVEPISSPYVVVPSS